MNRRNLLRRAPAVPFVLGAAVAQLGSIAQRIGQSVPLTVEETPLAQRLVWFTQSLKWQAKPTLPRPESIEEVGPLMVRAAVQWQKYIDDILVRASDYCIPIEEAERIVGTALR